MELSKFTKLCHEKWDTGRGDVQELYLREESYDELWLDILINRTGPVSILNASSLVNPATRSEVKVRVIDADKDLAVVHYKAGRKEQVHPDGLQCPGRPAWCLRRLRRL